MLEKEYVYERAMPRTTFVVRVRVEPSSKEVIWNEEVSDTGDIGRTLKTYKDCQILTSEDWVCELWLNGKVVEKAEMRKGALRQTYWGEERTFVARARGL